jgi:esterase/lipase superfamily enzyme
LEAIAAGEEPAEVFKLTHLVLMSPDIDSEVASQQMEVFASDPDLTTRWQGPDLPSLLRGRFTVYSSPRDEALRLSKFLFRSIRRVGQLAPGDLSPYVEDHFAKVGNTDLIVYEGRRTDLFGHSYFVSNPKVSADLIELIRNGTAPGAPARPLVRSGRIAWVFPESSGVSGRNGRDRE